jgi:hypothetical protein
MTNRQLAIVNGAALAGTNIAIFAYPAIAADRVLSTIGVLAFLACLILASTTVAILWYRADTLQDYKDNRRTFH